MKLWLSDQSVTVMPSLSPDLPFNFESPYDITPKLAFQYCTDPRKDRPTAEQADKYQFIVVEDWFCYPDFRNYHGPSNLAHVIRFAEIIEDLYAENLKIVCVRTSPKSMQRTNVALLISTYLMLHCGWGIEKICCTMNEIYDTTINYRTEGEGECDHSITIRDCLLGLELAFNHLDTLDLTQFDVEDLLTMEQPRNGDLNWIVPGQILALAGPTTMNWPISKFVEYAQEHKIGSMVRLNRPHYDANEVTTAGLEHVEMFMHDGTNPTPKNIRDFIEIVERMTAKGLAVAVHCRAGLGRTGTMIGAYLMFKYGRDSLLPGHPEHCPCTGMTSDEVARAIIGYLRIMRPGSVLSGQPEFLEYISDVVIEAGKHDTVQLIDFADMDTEVLSVADSIEVEISSLSSFFSSSESTIEQIRKSKRLCLFAQKKAPIHHRPVSHAGRGHAAAKHCNVELEKL